MADKYLIMRQTDTQEEVKVKLVDNGDGTYSVAAKAQVTGSTVPTSQAVPTTITDGISAKANLVSLNGDAMNLIGVNGLAVAAVMEAVNGSGQADRLRVDAQKNLLVGLKDGSGTSLTLGNDANDGQAATTGIPVRASMMGWNGASWDRRRVANVSKTVSGTAVASGAGSVVWTPAASKRFRLQGIVIAASVAGLYSLRDSTGTVFATVRLEANVPLAVLLPDNGYLSIAINNTLYIYNNTAGAADMTAWAMGNEE